jgi:hypothetical protein
MCVGVYFKRGDEVMRVFYPNPKAVQPWGEGRSIPASVCHVGWLNP